jgi:pyridoxamine 5'-phosphate oxidase family protein
MAKSQKFRNIAHNDKVAFVIDDIASRDPWRVRCLEIRGTAEQAVAAAEQNGAAGDALDRAIIRITPRRIISFGIDDTDTAPHELKADIRDA